MRTLIPLILAGLAACAGPSLRPCEEKPADAAQTNPIPDPLPEWYPRVIDDIVGRLTAGAALDRAVVVEVMYLPGAWGWAMYDAEADAYRIVLDNTITEPDFLIAVLIHEWAHCLVWGAAAQSLDDDHGSLWGNAYSMAYRAVQTRAALLPSLPWWMPECSPETMPAPAGS